uniref:Uncharacterized protein n=1 Tax=Arion vulgaris TaxID=1028688 RepID=A0A0B7ATW3_9EUPU
MVINWVFPQDEKRKAVQDKQWSIHHRDNGKNVDLREHGKTFEEELKSMNRTKFKLEKNAQARKE